MRKVTSLFVSGHFGIFLFSSVFLFVFLSLIFPASIFAANFSVDDTGGDCGSGIFIASSTWESSTRTCLLTDNFSDTSGVVDVHLDGSNIVFDGGGHVLSRSNIYVYGRELDTVKNIGLVGGTIFITLSASTTIDRANVKGTGGEYGILITDSPHTSIRSSVIENAATYGLYARGDITGLFLRDNSFIQNVFVDTTTRYHGNIFIYSPIDGNNQGYHIDIDQSNTVDGHIIYYFENQIGTVFDALPNAGLFYCVQCQNITLSNTVFQSTHERSQVNIFASTNSTIASSTIQQARQYGVFVYVSPHTIIRDNVITWNTTGVEIFSSPYASFSGNIISNSVGVEGVGLEINKGNDDSFVTQNTFENNNVAVSNQSPGLIFVQNNIADNISAVDNFDSSAIFSQALPIGGNYWGPTNVPHLFTKFDKVYKDFLPWNSKNAWLLSGDPNPYVDPVGPIVPFVPAATSSSNVLFLPGLEASRLYDASSTRLWEPSGDALMSRLYNMPDGTSVEHGIYAGDIIDNAYIYGKGNIYKSFIDDMNNLVSTGNINAWKAVPYDWRMLPDQILSQEDKNIKINIIHELENLASTSQTHKVTIVAHSYGGLVTKRLTEILGSRASTLIDKIIFVAVPQLGTPKAIGGLLHGFEQGIGSVFIGGNKVSPQVARVFGRNIPAAYTLLPSDMYFKNLDKDVVTFKQSVFQSHYTQSVNSQDSLANFVNDSWREASSSINNLNYPSVGNSALMSQAKMLHTDIDTWTPPPGVKFYSIAGWGEETVSGIEYYTATGSQVLYRPHFTLNGDGTVTVPSALWSPLSAQGTTSTTPYWLDLVMYNHDHPFSTLGKLYPHLHADILEVDPLRDFIRNIIIATSTSSIISLSDYISTSTPVHLSLKQKLLKRLHFFLHSPLVMTLYNSADGKGDNNDGAENIEDIRRDTFGEVQYISVPADSDYRLEMNAFASGSFILEIIKTEGDVEVASTTITGTVSTTSVVKLDISVDFFDHTSSSTPSSTPISIPISIPILISSSTTNFQPEATSSNAQVTGNNGSGSSSGGGIDKTLIEHLVTKSSLIVAVVPEDVKDVLVLKNNMYTRDPLQQIEHLVKEAHDTAGKYTKPVLKRYPLLFTFFLTFSVASVLHGFDLMTDEVPIFHAHPVLLVIIGALALFLTGTLYKMLERDKK